MVIFMSDFEKKLNEIYNMLKDGQRISTRTLFSDGTNMNIFLISYNEIIKKKANAGNKKAQYVDMYNNDKNLFYFYFKLHEAFIYVRENKYPDVKDNIGFKDMTNMGLWLQSNIKKIKDIALNGDEEAKFIVDSYNKKDVISDDDLALEAKVLEEIEELKKIRKEILLKLQELNRLENSFRIKDNDVIKLLDGFSNNKLKKKLDRRRFNVAIIRNNLWEIVSDNFKKIFIKK